MSPLVVVQTGSGAATPILAALITAFATSLVATVVWSLGRRQSRAENTLDLHKEYYSAEFGVARREAERFVRCYWDVNWAVSDPYDLPDPEDTRKGYSQVVRFFHRLAVLETRGYLDQRLAGDLFGREIGLWFGLIFLAMEPRGNWWTGKLIFELSRSVARNSGKILMDQGFEEGQADRFKGPLPPKAGGPSVPTAPAPAQEPPAAAPVRQPDPRPFTVPPWAGVISRKRRPWPLTGSPG